MAALNPPPLFCITKHPEKVVGGKFNQQTCVHCVPQVWVSFKTGVYLFREYGSRLETLVATHSLRVNLFLQATPYLLR